MTAFGTSIAPYEGYIDQHETKGDTVLKHLTLVTCTLLMLIFLTPEAFAQPSARSAEAEYIEACTAGGRGLRECRQEYLEDSRAGGNDNECRQATQQRNQARNEFSGTCSGSGFTSGGGSGHFACSQHVACCIGIDIGTNACTDVRSQYSDPNAARGLDDQFNGLMEQLSNLANPQQAQQIQRQLSNVNLQRSYNQCPMRSRVDMDTAVEDAEEARESVEQKELELSELQEELTVAQNELQAELDAIQTEKEELDAETQAQLDSIEQQLEDENEQIAEQIMALEQQLIELRTQETNFRHEKQATEQNYRNALTQLNADCHNRALERVQAERQANLELAAQGLLTAELQTVFQSVGSSNFEDMQRQVDVEYRRCQADANYRWALKSAREQRDIALQQLNDAINALEEPRRMINQQIAQYQTEEMSEALRRNMRALSRLNSEYERGMNRLNRKYEDAQRQGRTKIAHLQERIMIRQRHLASAQESLAYKQTIADTRRQYANGGQNIELEQWTQAQGKYFAFVAANSNYVQACCRGGSRASDCTTADQIMATHDPNALDSGTVALQEEPTNAGVLRSGASTN